MSIATRLGHTLAQPSGEVGVGGGFPGGAAILTGATSAGTGGAGVVLSEEAGPRTLGGALVWALRNGLTVFDLVVDRCGGELARRASYFDLAIRVYELSGVDELAEAVADPLPAVLPAPDLPAELAATFAAADVDVVVEHGVIRGEVLGLEVARVVSGDDGELHIEVGVGRFDREASAMVNEARTALDTLERAAGLIRASRHRGGSATHPLYSMGRSRWLRRAVLEDPTLLGETVDATGLRPVEVTVDAPNLRDTWPAAAVGTGADGTTVVVVATAGLDLDVFPIAADTRALHAPDARLVVIADQALPAALLAVNDALLAPAEVVVAGPGWS